MTDAQTLNAASYGPEWAAIWDREFGTRPDTHDAVHTLAELAAGRAVLEFGIGTGRLALPLVEKGLTVRGVDNSPWMLEQLKAKPQADGIDVVEGDFATATVDGEYGLVFISSHALFALTSQDEQVRCFENAAAHLVRGGVFAIEVMAPQSGVLDNGRCWTTKVDADSLTMFVSTADHVSQQMRMCHFTLNWDGTVRLRPAASRYAWPAELDLMARIAGMRLRDRWGAWDQRPFTAQSTAHVSVYERT
ncbi:class I SAM-dependent DNA methyltransferase [Phytoactinopolyspora limicola]|uniref:class I SAM-dependent DNA methyltransferase n=1 Tax=Phytoactinopolyspora limicola TaxID=2715536 RepID=UPI00140925FE|nr:class I SAM-dependent methyltransferase [Phytoactinopolyspora limicola]